MADQLTFEQWLTAMQGHFVAREYAQALELTEQVAPQFAAPNQQSLVWYYRSCLAARLDQPEQAVALLDSALEHGFWYSDFVLRQTPSWQALQGQPAFEDAAARMHERYLAAQAAARPRAFTWLPEQPATTLLAALHGNTDNGPAALAGWLATCSQRDIALAALESGQLAAIDSFIWDDEPAAETAVQTLLAELTQALKPERLILAGFSRGAETALRLALTGAVQPQALVLLGIGGVGMDDPNYWVPLLEAGPRLPVALLIGTAEEQDMRDYASQMTALFISYNYPLLLIELPDHAHEYPRTTAPFVEALDWIDDQLEVTGANERQIAS